MIRSVFCACGTRLEAPNDIALFERYRAHIHADHSEVML